MKMTALRLEESKRSPGEMQSPREAIRDQAGEATKRSAADEVLKALAAGARQVIYFAQDKLLLRDLRVMLLEEAPEELHHDNVHVLDASVPG